MSMESQSQEDDQLCEGGVGVGGGVDMRKRKRMISNRESARRSRQRKQQHLDNLMVEINQLKIQNDQILVTTKSTRELYLNVESENDVLRAQLDELTNRLNSLNDIVSCLNGGGSGGGGSTTSVTTAASTTESDDQDGRFEGFDLEIHDGFEMMMMNPWGFSFANCSVLPAMDAFMC